MNLPGGLSLLDLFLVIGILLLALRGCFRGLASELAGLFSALLAFLVTSNRPVHDSAKGWLTSFLGDMDLNDLLVYVGVFVLVWGLSLLALELLGRVFAKREPSWGSRFLGGLVALFKGAVLASLVLLMISYLAPQSRILYDSALAPPLNNLWRGLDRLSDGLQHWPVPSQPAPPFGG